ncbi:hypothetical protein [Sphingomonas sp. CCH9-H8]|nr:hypothetical protein [Sphingomonas sp. CCH9-H8]
MLLSYDAPKLICHGQITTLTQTSATGSFPGDGGTGPNWYPS